MPDHLRKLAPEPPVPRSNYTIQGQVPDLVLQPIDREQAAAVMQEAQAKRLAVIPWGGGTQQDFGYPPERLEVVLDVSRLRRIIAYEPADLTVTVEAGCTLADLEAVLAEHRQTLPLDPPCPEKATLGGLLATNTNGPLRYGNGAWRDRLLGLRALRADGTLIKGGSRVVKNAAGLDLGKLFIGSLGTLGIIVEATFKLQPRPASERLLCLHLPSAAASEEVLAALMETPLWPALIELRGGQEQNGNVELFVGFQGPEETVAWEVRELGQVLAGQTGVEVREVAPADQASLRRELADFPAATAPAAGRISLRVSLKSSEVAWFCQTILDQAADHGAAVAFQASAGNGVLHLHLEGPPSSDPAVLAPWVQQLCQAAHGNLMVTAAPAELKPHLPVWGTVRDDFMVMQRIKEQMDPDRILNPGRFVGRL